MIDLQQMKSYFPAELRENAALQKYMLKEYVQLLVLDFLSTSTYVRKIAFIENNGTAVLSRLATEMNEKYTIKTRIYNTGNRKISIVIHIYCGYL